MKELKVSGGTPPKSFAGSVLSCIEDGDSNLSAIAIGAQAVNQCVKGLAVAVEMGDDRGLRLSCVPEFCTVDTTSGPIVAMRFRIEWYKA